MRNHMDAYAEYERMNRNSDERRSRWPWDKAKYFTDVKEYSTSRINLYLFTDRVNTWKLKPRIKRRPQS